MSQLRVAFLSVADVEVWSRCETGDTRRKACRNELRALFASGASEPGLLWWAREDGAVLARCLWVREPAGLSAGLLELPWRGAWRGVLRRLLERMLPVLERRGHLRLEIGAEALRGTGGSVAQLGAELEQHGFVEAAPRAELRLRRLRTVTARRPGLPDGAELDGDDGGRWRMAAPPDAQTLAEGLELLAGQGALWVGLEWTGTPGDVVLPGDGSWEIEASGIRRAWVREKDTGGGA
jgi:hypothetical protein